jgi:hypothetical protein
VQENGGHPHSPAGRGVIRITKSGDRGTQSRKIVFIAHGVREELRLLVLEEFHLPLALSALQEQCVT